MTTISGNKDIDREILLKLSNEDLISACTINRYFFNIVCDDNFFYRKLLFTYPNSLKYFQKNSYNTYKEFYLKVTYYVFRLLEDFNYAYTTGNPKKQYKFFKRCENSQSLLYKSAYQGEIELVKEAIERGIYIPAYGEYALKLASINGHLEIVKYLVEYTIPIFSYTGNLVERKINIHVNDEEALLRASENGHLEVVKYLISLGADIHADNNAALRIATLKGHLDVVRYLREL